MSKYSIYIVNAKAHRDFAFVSYEMSEILNGVGSIERKNYDKVYSGTIEDSGEDALDRLYEEFNIHRPDDYRYHSMSVSDVVELDGEYWYCNDIGWKKLNW